MQNQYVAIISDTHDNLANIDKFLNYAKLHKITTCIHCGDITTIKTKEYLIDNFHGKIFFVEGNADILNKKNIIHKTNKYQKIKKSHVPFIELTINNIAIAACHKKDKAERLANKNVYDIIYYGHTHKPWEETINSTKIINPGTLSGMFTPPTFALLDTNSKMHKLILVNEL